MISAQQEPLLLAYYIHIFTREAIPEDKVDFKIASPF